MTSLYIHIPFCKKKCNYCDFVSYAGKEDQIDEYVEKLCKEIQNSPHFNVGSQAQNIAIKPHNELLGIETIYFGGGTPTLLSPEHIEQILNSATTPLPLGEGPGVRASEISVEANPGTANLAKLKALRQLGINRLSIGAQSFNNKHLQMLGRIHTSEDIYRIYSDAREAGFNNINLDLMFALPSQTLDEWKDDLNKAIKLNPEHLSTYNLQIEEGTPFSLLVTRYSLPDEDEELAMYEHAIETLTAAGYKHYEISNFAKPGFECKHNINYWKNGDYIGVGTGACSQENRNSKSVTIFMGLRLLEGLEIEKFTGFEKEVVELIEDGLLVKEKNRCKLSRKGLYLANLVFEKFI